MYIFAFLRNNSTMKGCFIGIDVNPAFKSEISYTLTLQVRIYLLLALSSRISIIDNLLPSMSEIKQFLESM